MSTELPAVIDEGVDVDGENHGESEDVSIKNDIRIAKHLLELLDCDEKSRQEEHRGIFDGDRSLRVLAIAKGRPTRPESFDQVMFEPVTEEEYIQIEKEFDSGRYSFKDEITTFKRRQEHGVESEEASDNGRERILLKEWKEEEESKSSATDMQVGDADVYETQNYFSASLSGSVRQVKTRIGDLMNSEEEVLVVLEAMKTEITVSAGEENVGLRISGFGKGVKEGKVVQAGDKLVLFAE
ncbi:hypothetical protein DFH11DRAFT_1727035 [Phellopilus nigrolimitatus]|nr:hypothetical protein DFH11DRAFT_1727035 [Phellopilus nigrolimitatus]